MNIRLLALAALLLAAISAMPADAHHDVVAMFDPGKEVTVTGTVVKIMWMNPHVSIVVDVKSANGKVDTWQVEMAPPHTLPRVGLNKDTIPVSSSVTVTLWPARDGSRIATGRKLTLPDGKQLGVQDALGWKTFP